MSSNLRNNCSRNTRSPRVTLVTTVLHDTTDGTEVWKTVSYMLLDCLVNLSRDDKHGNILSTLVRHGFLDVFVQDIKD
jgi:nuclear pore complex protein Nup205